MLGNITKFCKIVVTSRLKRKSREEFNFTFPRNNFFVKSLNYGIAEGRAAIIIMTVSWIFIMMKFLSRKSQGSIYMKYLGGEIVLY